jgi:hypothetical protein
MPKHAMKEALNAEQCDPIPLTKEESAKLKECEKDISSRQSDFVDVGTALATIQEHKLYRGRKYTSFQGYCQGEWGLPRHTAFIKIKVSTVYKTLRQTAKKAQLPESFLPTNESQVRQLLILREPALQWRAWCAAVSLQEDRECPLTASVVKEAVSNIRTDQTLQFQHYLTADASFPMIPFRMDIYTESSDPNEPRLKLDPIHLFAHHATPPFTEASPTPVLVLVSPGYDLFDGRAEENFLASLIELLSCAPAYRFLLWTSVFRQVVSFQSLPSNVEWVVCVHTPEEIAAVATSLKAHRHGPQCSLWVVPTGTRPFYTEIAGIALTRLLVSAPDHVPNPAYMGKFVIRPLITSALTLALPLHLSAAICDSLGL